MTPIPAFARLSSCLYRAGKLTQRAKAVDTLAAVFRDIANDEPRELAAGAVLASGKPLGLSSVSTAGDLGLGARGVLIAASEVCGVEEAELQKRTRTAGDIAVAVVDLSREGGRELLAPHALLSPREVVSAFERIASVSGRNSTVEKQRVLKELLSQCAVEAEILLVLRLAMCNARHGLRGYGLAERSVLAALAQALSPASVLISSEGTETVSPKEAAARRRTMAAASNALQTAFARCPDYARMCELLLALRDSESAEAEKGGQRGDVSNQLSPEDALVSTCGCEWSTALLQSNGLQPGIPAQPMLANPAKSISDAFQRLLTPGAGHTPMADQVPSVLCEAKYDGERVQIHWQKGDTECANDDDSGKEGEGSRVLRVFARSTEESTAKFRDVAENAVKALSPTEHISSFILDGEACAVKYIVGDRGSGVNESTGKDAEAGNVVQSERRPQWLLCPFQTLSRRTRKEGLDMEDCEDPDISACVFAFDLLFLNGKSLVDMSLRKRRKLLRDSFRTLPGSFAFAHGVEVNLIGEESRVLLEDSVCEVMSTSTSPEGVILKRLDGEMSSYGCGKRSYDWMKLKRDFIGKIDLKRGQQHFQGWDLEEHGQQEQLAMEGAVPLSDSLDLVVCGAYWGKGKRAGKFGSFLMALQARPSSGSDSEHTNTDDDDVEFETICKIGTGFSEHDLELLTASLQEHVISPIESDSEFHGVASSPDKVEERNALEILRSLGVLVSSRLRPMPDVVIDFRNRPSKHSSFVWEVKATDITPSPVHSATRTVGALSDDRGIGLRFPRFVKQRLDKGINDATDGAAIKAYLGDAL